MKRCLILWMPSTLLTNEFDEGRFDSYLFRSNEKESHTDYDEILNEIDAGYINEVLPENNE